MAANKKLFSNKAEEVSLSKKLAYILRHGAAKEGIEMQSNGFCKVKDILALKKIKHARYTLEHIKYIVDNNDKKRYALKEIDGVVYIRANQGHSVEVEDLELKEIKSLDDLPNKTILHGTYYNSWETIKKEGLNKMNRTHIHFAIGDVDDNKVVSGRRNSCQVLIYLNVEKCLQDKIPLLLSANNVVLSTGIDGVIPPKYFKCVLSAGSKLPFDNDFPMPL